MAVMGELGRYPLFIKSLSHCLNYKASLESKPINSLVNNVLTEMNLMSDNGEDCWLSRIGKIEQIIGLRKKKI